MSRLLLAVAILTAACAGHTTPPPPTPTPVNPPLPLPPPPPARGNSDVIRLGPSALRYVMHQIIHIDQEFQGMRQPLDFGLRAFFAVTITGPANTSAYPTTITIDSILAGSGTPAPLGTKQRSSRAA